VRPVDLLCRYIIDSRYLFGLELSVEFESGDHEVIGSVAVRSGQVQPEVTEERRILHIRQVKVARTHGGADGHVIRVRAERCPLPAVRTSLELPIAGVVVCAVEAVADGVVRTFHLGFFKIQHKPRVGLRRRVQTLSSSLIIHQHRHLTILQRRRRYVHHPRCVRILPLGLTLPTTQEVDYALLIEIARVLEHHTAGASFGKEFRAFRQGFVFRSQNVKTARVSEEVNRPDGDTF